ncbi:hypothetical protein PENSPDRAFT_730994 [Peniophora sp. CONT]|nr:hypothetical protein PENSPDRAFT_730994 [Peniophora sp. CONT]
MDLLKFNSPLDIFDHHTHVTPWAPFLAEDLYTSLSYLESYVLTAELIGPRLRELCPGLHPYGYSAQPRVLLVTPNNSLLLLTTIALWRLSCVVVPVQPHAEPKLWAGMIACCKPALVIAADSTLAQVEKCVSELNTAERTDIPVISLASLVPLEFRTERDAGPRLSDFIPSCRRWMLSLFPDRETQVEVTSRVAPRDSLVGDAVTLFTSSAVDQRTVKGVTYTHAFLVLSAIRTAETMGVFPSEFHQQPNRHLGWMPLSHCFEFGISLCGVVLTSGGSYVFFDNSVSSPSLSASTSLPKQLLAALAYFGDITSFSGVPFISQGIADAASHDDLLCLRRLRYFNVAGAPTPSSLFQWMVDNKIAYADSCGATEVLWIARRRAWDPEESARGLSLCPGLTGLIQKARTDDAFGELIIIGKGLPTRYDNVDTGAFSFDPHSNVTTYRTGDLYRHDENIEPSTIMLDGQPVPAFDEVRSLAGISYIGRVDDTVVLSTGEKVDALAIEQGLEKHMDIERAAIVAGVHGDALLALIQPRSSNDIAVDWSALADAVLRANQTLPFEKRIRCEHIFFVEQLPLTPKNTLHRKRLREVVASLNENSEVPHIFPSPEGAPPAVVQHTGETNTIVSPTVQGATIMETDQLSPVSTSAIDSNLAQSNTSRSSLAVPHFLDTDVGLRDEVVNILAHVFDVPRDYLQHHATALANLPLTSLASVRVSQALGEAFSVKLRSAEMYAMHTVDDVCATIRRHQHGGQTHSSSPKPDAMPTILQPRPRAASSLSQQICITGAACRFVGGIDSLSAYWAALMTPDSFLESLPHAEEAAPRRTACSTDGSSLSLDDAASGFATVQSFANFFGILPKDAESMSLNTRLVLQMGYEAVQDAGVAPGSLSGTKWGIFTAVNESGWRVRHSAQSTTDAFSGDLLNLADDAAVGRLAYYLNVNGPAVDIKTACSSSAVAIHQACLAIRNEDCDAAIVIAATTHVDTASAAFRMKAGIASPSGRCLPFSQWADGFVPGEGTAAIVLQKYSKTSVEPYAVLRSSAIVQDGSSRGFTSPNPTAQKGLLKMALTRAGCSQDDVCFIEAHGTGTRLGDSVELLALADVYQGMKHPLYIGSSKAVIGHTEECAGLAGVLKAILCFKYDTIPPQPFTGPLHETLESPQAPFLLSSRPTPLLPSSQPRLIGISSFGLSGTLAHIILQEPVPRQTSTSHSPPDIRPRAFVLSAATESDLHALAIRYLRYLGRQHFRLDSLPSICIASRLTRDHHAVRRAFFVRDWRELLEELQAAALACVPCMPSSSVSVGIWFGIPSGSKRHEPLNAHTCALYETELEQVDWKSQYDFFAAQLALARTLVYLGIRIHAVGGEGAGELVAGVVAGTISPSAVFSDVEPVTDDAAFAIAHCTQNVLEEYLVTCTADEARLVGHLTTGAFTLRGTRAGLEVLAAIPALNIDISDDDALIRPCRVNGQAIFKAATIPLFTATAGGMCDDTMTTNPAYWQRAQSTYADGERACKALVEQCQVVIHLGSPSEVHPSLGYPIVEGGHIEELLCQLYEAGCDISWEKLEPGTWPTERLPGYVWAASDD